MSAASPTPPSPTTATLRSGGRSAVLTTAPTPVITAQPNTAADSKLSERSTRTSDSRRTVAYSANAETPR